MIRLGRYTILWIWLLLGGAYEGWFIGCLRAHRSSDAFVRWSVEGTKAEGRWDIAVLDLDAAVDLDENDDGAVTWGELQARERVVKAYAMTHLEMEADGQKCEVQVESVGVSQVSGGHYASLTLGLSFSTVPDRIKVCYRAFGDLDPLHRSFVTMEHGSGTATAVFSPRDPCHDFDLKAMRPWGQMLSFSKEGVWHIWTGYDHILFLFALLLPSVLIHREGVGWCPGERFRSSLIHVVKIVTAFTLAHSLTLGIAVLGWVRLPSKWVECTIAVSVLLAAANNLRPLVRERGWLVAFGFGLIHGFGFASVMSEMVISKGAMALALVSFNVGVEAGQLVLVGVFLPTAFLMRRTWVYQRLVFRVGSVTIGLLALLWFMERALEIRLI